jgi:hypothetical protein
VRGGHPFAPLSVASAAEAPSPASAMRVRMM